MKLKRSTRTIQQFLEDGHSYMELQGRKITQDGKEMYISNRLFSEKEVNFQEHCRREWMRLFPSINGCFTNFRAYGGDTADADMVDWIYFCYARVEEDFDVPDNLDVSAMFEYQGFTFIPAGTWHSWNIHGDFKELNSHLKSDRKLKMDNYMGKDHYWNHKEFYQTAGKDCEDDIFFCVERQHYYVPCENEMFQMKAS